MKPKVWAGAVMAALALVCAPVAAFAQPAPKHNSAGAASYDDAVDAQRIYCVDASTGNASACGGGSSLTSTAKATSPTCADGTPCGPYTDLHGGNRTVLQDGSGNVLSFSDIVGTDVPLNTASTGNEVDVLLDGGLGLLKANLAGLTASGATFVLECIENAAAASPVYAAKKTTTSLSSITADGDYRWDIGGDGKCRFRPSVAGTGSVTINLRATTGIAPQPVAISSGALTQIIQADAGALLNMTTATTTKLIAGVVGKKTYITHLHFMANGTTSAKLVSGTRTTTDCDTGQADLTESEDLTAQVGFSEGSGLGPIYFGPAGKDICAVNGSGVNLHVYAAHTQF